MRKSYLATAIAAVAAIMLAPPAAANPSSHLTVRPGQSIQDALDAARPGDSVTVLAGVYAENLEIIKDRVTLRGRGARLVAPATTTQRRCSRNFGNPTNPYGICVAGEFEPGTGTVSRPVRGVTIEGLTIGQFPISGIVSFGAAETVIKHNDIAGGPGDTGYSVLLLRSSDSKVLRNRVHGAGGAGIYIGSSPEARAVVADNIAINSGTFGIMLRDSVGGIVERNLSYDNCMGMGFVDGVSRGTAASWTARKNIVVRNNRVCPGEPDVSGVGILLAGAHEITIERNTILDNTPASDSVPYGGGIVLASGSIFGGTELASRNLVRSNTVLRNQPADLNVVEAGPGNQLTGNHCRSSQPAGFC